ncbi:MAG: alpha/beta fold hydrolase [Planctomycetes bacterium]|nr:alpha/beta fold hydrolase [Planctomycetota bacterium]
MAQEAAGPVECEFKAEVDGSTERYVEILPQGFDPAQPHDLALALHGHGSDRWQYAKDARGECKGARDVAAKHSMIFVSPDYRAKTSWMGPKAEADVVQLIGLLRKKYKIRKVFLVGGSMGGTSVLIFAGLHPDLVDGVSSQNGTANMVEYQNFAQSIVESYGGDKKQKPDEYKKRSPELFSEKLTMPLAFTTGGKDTAVPPDSVRRLAEALKKAKRDDVLYNERTDNGHSTSYQDTVEAFEFVIKAAEKRKSAAEKTK